MAKEILILSEQSMISQIVRTKRRSLVLQITPDARLVIRAPAGASEETIRKAVQNKMRWILKRQRIARETYRPPVKFVDGEEFMYLGERYKLRVVPGADAPLVFDEKEFLLSGTHLPEARRLFEDWYKEKAFALITSRIRQHAEGTGLKYTHISITSAKRRWGSCSLRGRLNFTWRLAMTPLAVVDYVIVHELAHLEEHNHSGRFWRKVGVLMPNYPQARQWLKNNHLRLNL
jgi:predicted metal-dependent hydrolase